MLTRAMSGWTFDSENSLESLVWSNLSLLFAVKPIARQFPCRGEICDIVAMGSERELIILELKNSEDRYLCQQLTRYYDNLMAEKPWNEEIDYGQPVKLIGIAPSFHRHNIVDQKYLKLELELLNFSVEQADDGTFWLSLQSFQQKVARVQIPYVEVHLKSVDLPTPPQWFAEILGAMPPLTRKRILSIREQILRFDSRIQEIEGQNSIIYGKPVKGKQCAELIFERKTKQPILFLWLPFQERDSGLVAGRHRVWTDWHKVTHLASVGEGLGDKKTLEEQHAHHRQRAIAAGKTPRDLFPYTSQKTAKEMSYYAGRMSYP
ncbi:MAG: hypothetical protein LH660_00285, partial [Phormidesmis sp. CAN_BIN36]|nr:hypothetical protein [Phormidesmis sp. CAN_BIN36]